MPEGRDLRVLCGLHDLVDLGSGQARARPPCCGDGGAGERCFRRPPRGLSTADVRAITSIGGRVVQGPPQVIPRDFTQMRPGDVIGALASPAARERSARLHQLGAPHGSFVAIEALMNAAPLTSRALVATLPVLGAGAVVGQLSPDAFPWKLEGASLVLVAGPLIVGALVGAWQTFVWPAQ